MDKPKKPSSKMNTQTEFYFEYQIVDSSPNLLNAVFDMLFERTEKQLAK